MSARDEPQFTLNPSMLKWAREWRGRTLEAAAAKVGKTPEQVSGWENSVGSPTVRQARILADYYGRSFLEFFLPQPLVPPLEPLVPDFRLSVRGAVPPARWELHEVQRWAATQRVNALDLYDELGDAPRAIPADLFATIGEDPEEFARRSREALAFPIQSQISLGKSGADRLPNILRHHFESVGILTLRRTDLKDLGVRGICLAIFPLPVIVFGNESPAAQSFTLAHEFAHVLLKKSAITGGRVAEYEPQPIERWCDRFAASFLMPAEQIEAVFDSRPSHPREAIEDDELKRLADIFRVSPHAMLIRLVQLSYVGSPFYWDIKKPEFDAAERQFRSFARSSFYGSRYRSSLGDLYTGLVLEAWSNGRITNHNAAEYMGIKNLTHLHDIRDHFGGS